jgi:hypothetical protein
LGELGMILAIKPPTATPACWAIIGVGVAFARRSRSDLRQKAALGVLPIQIWNYSITSSACARIEGGNVMPSAVARLEVNDQIESGRLLHRQITKSLALQDFVHVSASATPEFG